MEGPASRQFYSIPNKFASFSSEDKHDSDSEKKQHISDSSHSTLLSFVSDNVIGANKTFSGPYGLRNVLYLDYVASGRALNFIEDYINNEVLPEYGNTHTTTSITSLQTTLFRHEARDIIRNSCNASEHDSVIFVGSGTTGAVHKLIHSLNLKETPIVFVGPYEHHSNILPWVEAGAEVVRISTTNSGMVDVTELESYLKTFQPFGKLMIGAFSAASNVTGVVTDVNRITVCLHKYGALAFWDYAAAGPYMKMDMNPFAGGADQQYVYKDAIYFSVHKFIGGVDTPGVLIVKKKLLQNPVPHGCGGGTVFFVRRDHHRYLVEPETKEEGGTPNIVGAIRAGLVFQLKNAIGPDLIRSQESSMLSKAAQTWSRCPNLVILGPEPQTTQRLPIISFLVHHPHTGLFLHHNFVSAVLNDVFGIQARGGCACAGPYAMDILGMQEAVSQTIEELLSEDSRLDRVHLRRVGEYSHREIIRPGFVRIILPYFLDSDGLEFVIQALALVSEHAWKLLPQYLFNPETGEWRNKQFQTFKDRKWLGHISYSSGRMSYHQPAQVIKGPLPSSYQDCLEKAKEIFAHAEKMNIKLADQSVMFDNEVRPYRWFLLPSEANLCLLNKWRDEPMSPGDLPFCPPALLQRFGLSSPVLESKPNSVKTEEVVQRLKQRERAGRDREQRQKTDDASVLRESTRISDNQGQSEVGDRSCSSNLTDYSEALVDALDRGFTLSDSNPEAVSNEDGKTDFREDANNDTSISGTAGKADCGTSSVQSGSVNFSNGDKNQENSKEALGVVSASSLQTSPADSQIETESESEKKGTAQTNDVVTKQVGVTTVKEVPKEKKDVCESCWYSPPKVIFKPTVQALEEYGMIQDGDRVLVCLSGGKDSLSLLHTIRQYQFYAQKKNITFKLGAVTVDPQTLSYDPSPLKKYLASLGVPYFYESQCIMETANNLPYECASICSFCSRMKRGRIYAAARREGYNVLALGQHLDDLAESFMMSFLHNGSLNTMKAHYTVKEGDLRVIRPFVYVRETELRNFAEQNQLPIIAENCPACFEAPKERHRTKQLLASQEVLFPQVYNSMMAALKPLMARGRQSEEKERAGVTSLIQESEAADDMDI